ncbi:phage portal protein [Octadecabacter sp. G9-8]|uniref:Phage portal protein n=1 Tax=Octadecabacter dasysiphoniae TaxID=2909341 RepID=A0ABS9CSV7_9RHOB|nr:phage portal protein [Octadecabacter dasysiphoniae]MCF2870310.1 phage portal protein [Octadecabacter dasysiphoniae]
MAWPFNLFQRDTPAPIRRSFDAATGGRRGQGFRPFGPTGAETLAAAVPVRSRARHAFANNGYIRNGVSAWVAETVGAGIEANSAHPDTTYRTGIDSFFLDASARIDSEGRTDLRGITAAIVEAVIVDGEAFAMVEPSPDGPKLRLIPAEMVDESITRDMGNGGYVAAGIEFNAQGQRVAYHVQPHRPTELFPTAGAPVRVVAEDMFHIFKPLGAGQVRGVSWLAPVLLTLNEFDQLQDALLVGAKIAAMHAGFVTDQNNLGGTGAYPEADSLTDISLEPGVVRVLPAGTDIKFNSPSEAKDSIAFAKLTLGQIAAGLSLPQYLLDGDLTGANYSSLRAGLLPFRAKVEQFTYHTLIPQFLDPVFRRVLTAGYLSGDIDFPELATALKAEWLPPRPMQVDPAKDVAALKTMIEEGLTSRRQAVASLGWNVAELDAEIAADRAREAALKLNFTAGKSENA